MMNPGEPPAIGTAAIRAGAEQAAADTGFHLEFRQRQGRRSRLRRLGAAHGTYKLTSTDPKTKTVVTTTGSYVTVYKPRPDGVWQAVWDIVAPGRRRASERQCPARPPPRRPNEP